MPVRVSTPPTAPRNRAAQLAAWRRARACQPTKPLAPVTTTFMASRCLLAEFRSDFGQGQEQLLDFRHGELTRVVGVVVRLRDQIPLALGEVWLVVQIPHVEPDPE